MSYNCKENEDKQVRELVGFHRKRSLCRIDDVSSDQAEVWTGNADESVCQGIYLKAALKRAKKQFQQECDAKYRQIFNRSNK